MIDRLGVAIGEMVLEWLVGFEQVHADRHRADEWRPMTEPRRGILRFSTLSRAWHAVVVRVAMACIEPSAALIDRLDAEPALWSVVRTVMLNWGRNEMAGGLSERSLAAVLRSARSARLLTIEAHARELERFWGHIRASPIRALNVCVFGEFELDVEAEVDEPEHRSVVSAATVRLLAILAPTLEYLDVGLAWADTDAAACHCSWPLMPRLDVLKVRVKLLRAI